MTAALAGGKRRAPTSRRTTERVMTAAYTLGIDFGTTNTVVALAGPEGPAQLVRFPAPEGELFAFRSCLSFHAPPEHPSERTIAAGPWAIEAYVEDPAETRFIQSFTGSRTCSPPSC